MCEDCFEIYILESILRTIPFEVTPFLESNSDYSIFPKYIYIFCFRILMINAFHFIAKGIVLSYYYYYNFLLLLLLLLLLILGDQYLQRN